MPINGFVDLQGNSWPPARSGVEAWLPRQIDREALLGESRPRNIPSSNLAERGVALVLLVLTAPLIALLALVVLVVDGWPVFYRGERLGLRKRCFTLYKIRSLRHGAERLAADRPIDRRDGMEFTAGRWLRDSRLDELPQLWNIVRGEMSFFGPRPERLQIYLSRCLSIPAYDLRFRVRPGMIGPSQLFTPHGTQERIRSWIDNAWIKRRSRCENAGLMLYAPLVVTRRLAARARELLGDSWRSLMNRPLQRRVRRVRPSAAVIVFSPGKDFPGGALARLVDINDEAFRVHSCRSLSPMSTGSAFHVRLETELAGGRGGRKIRSARCLAIVVQRRRRAEGYTFVLRYWPLTPRSHYVIHQYFLMHGLAPARRPARRRLSDVGESPRLWKRLGKHRLPSSAPVSTS